MGHTSEFLFSIYWWTWKTIIYQKKLLKWANKKLRILFYFKKTKKKTWRYHYFTPVHQKFRYDDTECDRLKLVIWSFFALLPPLKPQKIRILKDTESKTFFVISGYFLPFYPLWKIKIMKKWKQHLEMSSFYRCVPKITIIWCMFPKISSVKDIIFSLLGHFLPFYPTVDP